MITVIPAGLILLLNLQSINCLLEIKYGERTELSEFSLFPSKSQRKKDENYSGKRVCEKLVIPKL